jgi:hypothetical protein
MAFPGRTVPSVVVPSRDELCCDPAGTIQKVTDVAVAGFLPTFFSETSAVSVSPLATVAGLSLKALTTRTAVFAIATSRNTPQIAMRRMRNEAEICARRVVSIPDPREPGDGCSMIALSATWMPR